MSLWFSVVAGAAIGFILGTVAGRWLFRPQPMSRRLLLKTWGKISRSKMRRYIRKIPYAHEALDKPINLDRIGRRFDL